MIKILRDFLIENNCLDEFIENAKNCEEGAWYNEEPSEICGIISASFSWTRTSQGYNYWNKLDYKFNYLFIESSMEEFEIVLSDLEIKVDPYLLAMEKFQ